MSFIYNGFYGATYKFSTKEEMIEHYYKSLADNNYEVIADSANKEFILIRPYFDNKIREFETMYVGGGKVALPNGEMSQALNLLRILNRDYLFSMLPRAKNGKLARTPGLYLMYGKSTGDNIYPYFKLNKCCGILFDKIGFLYLDDSNENTEYKRYTFDNLYELRIQWNGDNRVNPNVLIDNQFNIMNMNMKQTQKLKKLDLQDLIPGCFYRTSRNTEYLYLGLCDYKRKFCRVESALCGKDVEVDELTKEPIPLFLRLFKNSQGVSDYNGNSMEDYVRHTIENNLEISTFDNVKLVEMTADTFKNCSKFRIINPKLPSRSKNFILHEYSFIKNC